MTWAASTWCPCRLWHGRLPILGFRFEFLLPADCNAFPDESWPLIQGTGAARALTRFGRAARDAFTIADALAVVERLGPRRAYFTHMTHDLPHAATNARLPRGVELAYDGLVLDIEVDAS